MKSIALPAISLLLLSLGAFAQSVPSDEAKTDRLKIDPPRVDEIEIKTSSQRRGGMMGPRRDMRGGGVEETDLRIRRNGDAYLLNGESVDLNLVANLIAAMLETPNTEPKLDDLGITQEWLKGKVASAVDRISRTHFMNGVTLTPETAEAAFTDLAVMGKLLPELFEARHYSCADCPRYLLSVEVSVELEDLTRITGRAHTRFPFMLPWEFPDQSQGKDKGSRILLYNADLSRAVAALMPEGTVNRSQLAGENLADLLVSEALRYAERQAQMQDVESKTGNTLRAIRAKYRIESAWIDTPHTPLPTRGMGDQPALRLRLTSTDLPVNFADAVVLGYADGTVNGADRFLRDGAKYEQTVMAVSWLQEYAKQHPRTPIEIAYDRDASFGEWDKKAFRDDMREVGREKMIDKVDAAKDGLTLVSVGSGMSRSDWLVFPDHHLLLWRFWRIPLPSSRAELPDWGPSLYSAKPCANAKNRFLRCAGREVSSTGELLPE